MNNLSSLEILEKLISFDTVADKNNRQIVEWLSAFLQAHGFIVKKILAKDKKRANLWAHKKGSGKNWLYFSGHTDTVPAGQNWQSNPWQIKTKGDKLYGLGTCDMKGGITAILKAVSETNNPKINLGLIFTYDEEINFSGIIDLFKSQKLTPGPVIIAEPTNNQPIVAHKGMLSFIAEFKGKAAHSSYPDKGLNAIINASDFISELRKTSAKLLTQKNKYFSPPQATNNPAIINGGDAINKIPAGCTLKMEYRVVEEKQLEILKKIIKQLGKKYRAQIKFDFELEPMISQNIKLIKTIERISGRQAGGLNYATEAVIFTRHKFSPIILGPGPIMAHLANEYVSQCSLEKSVKIFKEIINS